MGKQLAVLGVLAVAPMVRSAPPILDLSDSDEVEEAMASGEESGWEEVQDEDSLAEVRRQFSWQRHAQDVAGSHHADVAGRRHAEYVVGSCHVEYVVGRRHAECAVGSQHAEQGAGEHVHGAGEHACTHRSRGAVTVMRRE